MKNLLLPAIALLTFTSCSNRATMDSPAASPQLASLCERTHQLVNNYRQQKGLAPLERHSGLEQLAMAHSEWLLKRRAASDSNGNNVSHQGFGRRSWIAKSKFGMVECGENVAAILSKPKKPAEHLLLMWQSSLGHNKTMLDHWTHGGVAITIDDDGAIFATQFFGRQQQTTPNAE